MGSIPLPALLAQGPQGIQDPLQVQQNALRVRLLQGEQALQPGQQELQQQQVEAGRVALADEKARTAAWQQWDHKNPDDLPNLIVRNGGSADAAMQMQQTLLGIRSKASDIAKNDAETGSKNIETEQKQHDAYRGRIMAIVNAPEDQKQSLWDSEITKEEQAGQIQPGTVSHTYPTDAVAREWASHYALGSVLAKEAIEQQEANTKAQQAKTEADKFAASLPGGLLSPEAKAGSEAQARLNVESSPQAVRLAGQKAAIEANARQSAAQGSPIDAGRLLAAGQLTLADLKSRGTTPKFITQAVAAAQQVDPHYNPADEVIAESVAKSQSANQFFGSANSLIAKGGTLDQLSVLGKKIPQHDFPILNTVDDWQQLARGKGPLAAYAAMALGVADDYGKVMGGGTASDHARDAALQLFSRAASPDMREQAIAATRGAVQSQRDSRIGNNQFLKRQYGAELGGGSNANSQGPPAGATHTAMGSDGQLHWTDATGTKDYGVKQ
jgi:hypothetical protein